MSKPGRNDPCPCGSGKKYKKCCWSKEQAKKGFEAKVVRSGSGNTMGGIAQMLGNIPFPSAEPKDVPPPAAEKKAEENENA